MPTTLIGHVVSHTHWDRAWYWTFEQTRVRLLDLMDDLLDLMAAEPGYRCFVLDGQLAMVEDYLALRPERAASLRRLAGEGRLLLGPFYVLPDLFIPGGESLVRNLRAGHAAAAPLGPVMKHGYLPDPFGHPAQLPQVLAGFGIDGMLFSRGMGDEHEALGADFLWEAPDGSRVLATHQIGGYGNVERLGRAPVSSARDETPKLPIEHATGWAMRRLRELVREMAPHCPSGQLLLNNGCDHLPAQPELPALIAAVNRAMRGTLRLVHSTPPRYQRAVRQALKRAGAEPAVHRGELRGGRFANLLPGVLSARVDLKLTHDRCERLLLRWAEPFSALGRSLGAGRDDRALLEHAWRLLLLCQPHDDICGCSIDRVHEDDLGRMARVQEVAESVRDRALAALAARVGGQIVFNACPFPITAVVELTGLGGRGAAGPGGPLPVQRVRGGKLVQVELPPLGYARIQRGPMPGALTGEAVTVRQRGGKVTLDNGLLRLEVLKDRGELRLRDLRSGLTYTRVAELRDEGDAGDTYDFAPPATQRVVRGPERYRRVRVLEAGPLRARVRIEASLALPVGLGRGRKERSGRTRALPLRLELTLRAGSPCLDLRLELTNTVEEHRLRLTLMAPFVTDALICGAPFQVIRRPIAPPRRSGWFQPPLPYQPFQDLVCLEQPSGGGIALLAPGLREVEGASLRSGTRLELTLLRSVGWLSRDDLSTRTGEAGPCFEVQGARHLGQRLCVELGLLPYVGAWLEADVPRRYAELAAPPRAVAAPDSVEGTALPDALGLLEVQPSCVQLAALLPRDDGRLEARLVNLAPRRVRARVRGPYRGRRLGLDGNPRPGKVDLADLPLRPGEILTLELTRVT